MKKIAANQNFLFVENVKIKKHCDCQPDCRGVISAYKRAQQWGYPEVAKKALEVEKEYGCATKRSQSKRSKTTKYCRPNRHLGPRKKNPWIIFLQKYSGQGYTREELRKMYLQQKQR